MPAVKFFAGLDLEQKTSFFKAPLKLEKVFTRFWKPMSIEKGKGTRGK
jgi:hypothetical protein